MAFYRIREWSKYQHYKDRSPPWIKLHRTLMTSEFWATGNDASRVLAVACMLVAADTDNKIPANPAYIKRVAYLNKEPDFGPLVECGFLDFIEEKPVDSDVLAECKRDASNLQHRDRGETEERREETTLSGKPDVSPKVDFKETAKRVIDFLNLKTGKNFQHATVNLDLVVARLKDGATEQNCKSVIARKVRDWQTDDKMREYLRPATLFNREKFAQYMGQLVTTDPPSVRSV